MTTRMAEYREQPVSQARPARAGARRDDASGAAAAAAVAALTR